MTENDPTTPTPTAASCRSRMTPEGVYELRDADGRSYPQIIRVAGAAGPADVVLCTVYATYLDAYRRHGSPIAAEFFGATRPTSTVVEVARLADPRYLLEV